MLGVGVMFGGIMAGIALSPPWNGVAIIGSLAGGCAIMMAAR